jgi:hypothetical protein
LETGGVPIVSGREGTVGEKEDKGAVEAARWRREGFEWRAEK